MDCSTPGFPVHHQLSELAQTHVHWISDAIQPSRPPSVVPFSSFLQSFPASESFPMSQFFTSGQSIGASASASVLPIRRSKVYIIKVGVGLIKRKNIKVSFAKVTRTCEQNAGGLVVATLPLWRFPPIVPIAWYSCPCIILLQHCPEIGLWGQLNIEVMSLWRLGCKGQYDSTSLFVGSLTHSG